MTHYTSYRLGPAEFKEVPPGTQNVPPRKLARPPQQVPEFDFEPTPVPKFDFEPTPVQQETQAPKKN